MSFLRSEVLIIICHSVIYGEKKKTTHVHIQVLAVHHPKKKSSFFFRLLISLLLSPSFIPPLCLWKVREEEEKEPLKGGAIVQNNGGGGKKEPSLTMRKVFREMHPCCNVCFLPFLLHLGFLYEVEKNWQALHAKKGSLSSFSYPMTWMSSSDPSEVGGGPKTPFFFFFCTSYTNLFLHTFPQRLRLRTEFLSSLTVREKVDDGGQGI